MGWLFVARLKPFVMLAAFASLVLNLALLVPTLFMVQVFDRVFASRSIETLAMLGLLVLLALALAWFMDRCAHGRWRRRPRASMACWPRPRSARALQRAAGPERSSEPEALRDVAQLRNFLGSSGVQACSTHPGCRCTCW